MSAKILAVVAGLMPAAEALSQTSQPVTVQRAGSQPPSVGAAQNFTGAVRVDGRFQGSAPARISGGTVTFEPGARTAWHTHPLGQTLIVTAGVGLVQHWGGFTVRQIHTLAAYWVLIIVAIHLGLRWPMLMGVARNLFGIRAPSALRTLALRIAALAIALHGVWSCTVLGLGGKLSMQMTLDWWNFEESVVGFFAHCAAIAGLVMVVTYYGLKLVPRTQASTGRTTPADERSEPAAQGLRRDG